MNFLVNDAIIKAVSWTLIHSLWLGLAAAILAGLTLLLTKKATSATRYNLLAGLSIAFLVAIGFIFYSEFETQASVLHPEKVVNTSFQTVQVVSSSPTIIREEGSTPLSIVTAFVSKSGSWIVLIWFVVFLFKCIRMTSDIRQVYRARNYQTIIPAEQWLDRLSELKVSLRIKRSVQLLESKLVTVPSVTGFFKPVILVPVGLLNNIPQDQVEAILLHELAHIRRSDYAVNLMQTFIETLFFFNPGILWISSLLRDERENCCDDLAISVTNNKKEFVNALISFQEYNMHNQRFALQFGDQKMKLADRAKRILFNTNKKFSIREKYFLSVCAGLSVILFLVVLNVHSSSAQEIESLKATAEKYNPKEIPEGTAIKYLDDAKRKSHVYLFKSGGVLYQVPENLKNFKVDGKVIARKDRDKYLPQIKQLIDGYESAIASGDVDVFTGVEYPDVDLSEEEKIIDEASKIIDGHSAIIDKHTAVIDKHVAVIDKQVKIIDAETSKEASKMDWKKHNEAQRIIEEEQLKIEAETKKIDIEARKIDEQARKIDEQSRKIDAKLKLQEKELKKLPELNSLPPEKDITLTVIEELKKAGYKGKINSFELSQKALIINGKTQDEALFQKVKHYTKPGMRILYNFDTH